MTIKDKILWRRVITSSSSQDFSDSDPSLPNTWFPDPTQLQIPNSVSTGSAIFVGLTVIIIIIIIKGIYTAHVRKGHKCAMSAEMAVWLRNCLCLYSYLHN